MKESKIKIIATMLTIVIIIVISCILLFLVKVIFKWFDQITSHIEETEHNHSWIVQEIDNNFIVFCEACGKLAEQENNK